MAQGFIKNKTQPTITYANWSDPIKLYATSSSDAGHDSKSRKLPQSCSISHLDIVWENVANGASLLYNLRLTYDEACNDPVVPGLNNLKPKNGRNHGSADENVKFQSIEMGTRYFLSCPSTQTEPGALFLFVYPFIEAGGTADSDADNTQTKLRTARLHWRDNDGK